MILDDLKQFAREQSHSIKENQFYSMCNEPGSVLDVGISKVKKGSLKPLQNYFLRHYRFEDSSYTGLGVQDLSKIRELYPNRRFVEYPGGKFPFDDNEFEYVHNNSVIEHVGDDQKQLQFVNEMMRVGREVFFTTSNKYFPVEAHTNLLFTHWNNHLFDSWKQKHTGKCYNKYNPYLFSYRRMKKLMKESNASSFIILKHRHFGLVMTFSVMCN